MGDPAGVGPEVLLMALADPGIAGRVEAHVFGSRSVLSDLAERFGWPLDFELIESAPSDAGDVAPGGYTRAGGRIQVACLEAAADALRRGSIDALVTGPIHKRALSEAGFAGSGHTEWLARRFGARRAVMMLAGPRLRVVLATTHLPLREVASALTRKDLIEVIRLAHAELKKYFFPGGPRLAMAALNPHGEEDGREGREERELLVPVIEQLVREGIDLTGPVAADALFAQAAAGRYDAVVALYHDQGLAPLKALHFYEAVNVTLGLGFVRTSPDHGPAYDIAGQGRADPGSMKAAIALADQMVAASPGSS